MWRNGTWNGESRQHRENQRYLWSMHQPCGDKVYAVLEETETEREPKGTGTARLMGWLSYLERNYHSGDRSRTWGHSLFLWQASLLSNLVGVRETRVFLSEKVPANNNKGMEGTKPLHSSDKRNPESTTSISVKVLKRYAEGFSM